MKQLSLFIILFFIGIPLLQAQKKILFITSNQSTYGKTDLKTSNHFAEIVLAYDVLVEAGYEIDFVSPEGGEVPIGYIDLSNVIQNKYVSNTAFLQRLKETKKPSEIAPSLYVAVYYSGGGAAMFGVPENETIQHISESIYRENGVVAAVCHGTAGIVHLKAMNGKALYANQKITGFPDAFERTTKPYYKTFPFSIEQAIITNGGDFDYSEAGWDDYVVVSGRIITGQDPTASASVAKEMIKTLQNKL